MHSARCRRFRIERIAGIHPRRKPAHALYNWPKKPETALFVPEHSGPTTSLMAPTGRPPSSSASTAAMPVAAVSRMVRGMGGERRREAGREGFFDLES